MGRYRAKDPGMLRGCCASSVSQCRRDTTNVSTVLLQKGGEVKHRNGNLLKHEFRLERKSDGHGFSFLAFGSGQCQKPPASSSRCPSSPQRLSQCAAPYHRKDQFCRSTGWREQAEKPEALPQLLSLTGQQV